MTKQDIVNNALVDGPDGMKQPVGYTVPTLEVCTVIACLSKNSDYIVAEYLPKDILETAYRQLFKSSDETRPIDMVSKIRKKFNVVAVPDDDVPQSKIKWCRENAPELCKNMTDKELWEVMKDTYYEQVEHPPFKLVGSFEQGGYMCPKCDYCNNAYTFSGTCQQCGYR